MSDLDDSFAKLLGRQPTDEDRQELIRVRDALGLKSNDALWLILMALQHYQSLYADIPASIKDAAQKAAGSAASQAQAEVSKAVAALVPTVESAVGQAATAAVNRTLNRIQLGRSLISAWLAMVVLGAAFGLGWLFGGHIFTTAQHEGITWAVFLKKTGFGIGAGMAAPAFLLFGLFFKGESGETGFFGIVAVMTAFTLVVMLALGVWAN